jgi:hypothetical protein
MGEWMRSGFVLCGVVLGAAMLTVSGSAPAGAACKRLAFSVNDYGKEGPTRDAKALLDKYIADWTKTNGIKKYTVGKKDVSCELFLDFIVFDEHTCKASALVCWAGPDPEAPAAKPAADK